MYEAMWAISNWLVIVTALVALLCGLIWLSMEFVELLLRWFKFNKAIVEFIWHRKKIMIWIKEYEERRARFAAMDD